MRDDTVSLVRDHFSLWPRRELYIAGSTIAIAISFLMLAITDLFPWLPIVIVAICCFAYAFRNTMFWLSTLILLHYALFVEDSKGISVLEIMVGLYMYLPLMWWFIRKFLEGGGTLISSPSDIVFITFFCICTGSIFVALLNGNPLLKWFREYLVFVRFLLYFPIKEALRTEKNLFFLTFSFCLLGLGITLKHLFGYLSARSSIIYFWQVISFRQTSSEAVLVGLILLSASIFFLSGLNVRLRSIFLMLSGISTIALLLTFARGIWVAAAVGLVVVLLAARERKKRRTVLYVGTFFLGVSLLMFILFKDFVGFVIKAVVVRTVMTNIGAHGLDPSVYNRLVESGAMWNAILASPVLGHGLGYAFHVRDILTGTWLDSSYGHDSYLYLWMKLGLFGLVLFLATLVMKIREGIVIIKQTSIDPLLRAVVVGAIAYLVCTFVMAFSGSGFFEKDSVLVYSICMGILGSQAERRGELYA